MWAYNQEIDPPAPFIEVIIHHPEILEQATHIQAKIDTGADISAIPSALASQLRLPIASQMIVEGYDGISVAVSSYGVLLEVADTHFEDWEVITIPDSYVLLGRDVLNHFYSQLNGPELTFNLGLTPL